jgi:diguanylate cyclase (GGDEF)-like protein/putative nucleotidyltransferase with HDIG domain
MEKKYIAELSGMVNVDSLTGLYNHRFFHDKIKDLVSQSNKKKTPLSLIFIDIDYFKHYNDLHGHQQGDEVLQILGKKLLDIAGDKNFVVRYGGEEFAILMPDTAEDDAFGFAEKIRIEIQDHAFYGQEYLPNENLTISLGVSEYPDKAKTDIELIRFADDALYRAKFLKKNRVEGYSSILEDLGKQLDAQNVDIVTSVKTLITVINARDKYTFRHVERVVAYAKLLADKIKLSESDKKKLIYGAYMHDIGKIDIAKEVLMKPTKLTDDEWEQLRNHSENGVKIIQNVEALKDVIPIMLYHHEKYDGTGYPKRLKGEDIPYLARVLTVADSFDAMTSTRPYQKRKTFYEGIEELRTCSGTHFDPEIATAFIEVIRENVTELN